MGLIVNPIAGMGGRVGLKGTDGEEVLAKALALGARPVSPSRAVDFLRELLRRRVPRLLTPAGQMGEEEAKEAGMQPEVIGRIYGRTSAEDTKRAAREMVKLGVDLIVFVGGDGTARDVLDVVGSSLPVLGVPSGVKNHSAVFASSPSAAAELVDRFLGGELPVEEAEVLDVDEEAYRSGELRVKLYGYLRVPYEPVLMPGCKEVSAEEKSEQQAAIAKYVKELMQPGVSYILGPGTTTAAVASELGVEKTLLGVDIVREGELVAKDVNEEGLLREAGPCVIIVSPIGGQGFILGRGNQQISPRVVRKAGIENLWIVATPKKLQETPVLRVDTTDAELDEQLRGYRRVITGYRQWRVCKVL